MDDVRGLLAATADAAADFLDGLDQRPVAAAASLEELRASLDVDLHDDPIDARAVLHHLVQAVDPGVVAMASGRYFGFVIGSVLPAALAADWMTSVWDQNAGLYVGGPSAAVVEETAGRWLKELLGLPPGASFALVTGCQMAHFTALSAARLHVLERAGWDVNEEGLVGAPPIRVFVGADRHITVDRALRYLGIGNRSIVPVATDGEGRMIPTALAEKLSDGSGPAIVCAQVGEVNTGAVDPMTEVCEIGLSAGAWVHVDGAFGMWAAASPALRPLLEGIELADSWATDGHKWLNVPYDSGLAFCAHPDSHRRAMSAHADYLVHADAEAGPRDQLDWTPEFSRRARGFPIYAALRSLGRGGVAALVEGSCAHAKRLAAALAETDGVEVLNDVRLNQVLVRFGDDDAHTEAVIRRVQEGGECWMSGTRWRGQAAMRISVVNWRTDDDDIERTLKAITRAHASADSPLGVAAEQTRA
ncbi:MAG TPA: pyridoxal-dependent decarboxylase [Acidimicrobiales bacterium]|nr:pyridoxal-dependent decarboxylase [Acidimicrobiales bacterium]